MGSMGSDKCDRLFCMRAAETTLYRWPLASRNVPIGPREIWAAGVTSLDEWWPPPRLVKVEVVDGMVLVRPVSNWGPGGVT